MTIHRKTMGALCAWCLAGCAAEGTEASAIEALAAGSGHALSVSRVLQWRTEAAHGEGAFADTHWTYEGDEGPGHWAELDPGYALCADAVHQSPVDLPRLDNDDATADLADLEFVYADSTVHLVNTGHTVQWNYDAGSTLLLGGHEYELVQFHLHAHSEHTVAGQSSALELHLVHVDSAGQRLVVGVLIEPGGDTALGNLGWDAIPNQAGWRFEGEAKHFNIADLLPSGPTYRYQGSLTTPPCSEQVQWVVFAEPITLPENRIAQFTWLFSHSSRPTQPVGERVISFGE
jgi:carbonic anhydrase